VQHAITSDDIQAWLIARIASAAKCEPAAIDVRELVSSYGLSSTAAVSLTAEIEDWLDISLSPLLIWDHPTIEGLVEHIAEELAQQAPPGTRAGRHGT
jgi:acyl carrier protein